MTNLVDPLPAYSFYLEVNGVWEAGFTACTGLRVKRETQIYKEGGVNDYVHTLPGRISYSNITLKQGMAFSNKLWLWYINGTLEADLQAPEPWFEKPSLSKRKLPAGFQPGLSGRRAVQKWFDKDESAKRKAGSGGAAYLDNIAIVQCVPYAGTVVRRYYLYQAFPVTWSGPNLDTNSNQVAIETLELAIQKFTIDFPDPPAKN
jgi:hypothetical protein